MKQLTYTNFSKFSDFPIPLEHSVYTQKLARKRGVLGLLGSITLLNFQRKLQTETALELNSRVDNVSVYYAKTNHQMFPSFCLKESYNKKHVSYVTNAGWFLQAVSAIRIAGNCRSSAPNSYSVRRMLFNYVTSRGKRAPTFITTSSHL